MVVVPNGESNIHRVACEKRHLFHAFGHVPAEGVEGDFISKINSLFSVINFLCAAPFIDLRHSCGLSLATDGSAIGMAAWGRKNSGRGEFSRFSARPDPKFDVLVFQNARRRG